MSTKCNSPDLVFQPLGAREVIGRFDGGTVSSDGGCLLLGETERGNPSRMWNFAPVIVR